MTALLEVPPVPSPRAAGAWEVEAIPGWEGGVREALDAVARGGGAPLPGGRPGGGAVRVEVRGGALVVRRLARGGALRRLLPDLYPGAARARSEMAMSRAALRAGAPVAEVVGVGARRRGILLQELFVVSRFEEGSDFLSLARAGTLTAGAIVEAARAVAALADAGILHVDLHLGNLLWAPAGASGRRVVVLDLDRARSAPGAAAAMRSMSMRLGRSAAKWGVVRGAARAPARMRFLRALAAAGGLDWSGVRSWMRIYAGGRGRWR